MPWAPAPSAPTVPSLPSKAVGYALPVPVSLVTAHPALIGAGPSAASSAASRKARSAGPVTLAVSQGTSVYAVTEGTPTVIPAGNGTSVIVLSGTDGATYTYRNVIAAPQPAAAGTGKGKATKVKAGTKLGTSGSGGLTFSISVPDVHGLVDADEAMQSWASGLSIDVRSLPSTTGGASAAPARENVLLVTGPGAQATTSTLSKSLADTLVQVRTATLTAAPGTNTSGGADPFGRTSPVGQQIAASGGPTLVVAALANGTPAQAAKLAALLPAGHQLLWVAPAGTTPQQAAAYQLIVAAYPGFRVESLPAALAPAKSGKPAPASAVEAAQLATATLTATYTTTAYRLHSVSSEADAALSWAEQQLGKPYLWAAAGPDSFDCSGLTMDALAQAGIAVTHNANSQWKQTRAHSVPESKLQSGDLVFFAGSDGTIAAPGHVGIYVGAGEIIDAPFHGTPVRFDPLSSIRGYTGATDPYTLVPASVSGSAAAASRLAQLAVPATLSQYQSFARQLADSTWGPSQFPALYLLWQRESGWDPAALNPISGAFGIPQSLPATKMSAAGMDWASDPYTQMIWGIGYIQSAYGDPQAAWAHELAFGWY
jgi:cell wall-associated NlpC family hydrolase